MAILSKKPPVGENTMLTMKTNSSQSIHATLTLLLLALGAVITLVCCAFFPAWIALLAFACTLSAVWAVHEHAQVVGELGSQNHMG